MARWQLVSCPARAAGASGGEAPAPVAGTRQEWIRTKSLKFLDSRPGKQVITGRQKRIISDFQHQRSPGANEVEISVHDTFDSRGIVCRVYPSRAIATLSTDQSPCGRNRETRPCRAWRCWRRPPAQCHREFRPD